MEEYAFLTIWHIEAPIHTVFKAIHQSLHWPSWWKGVEQVVEIEPGDQQGVGGLYRFTFKSRLPYRLTFNIRVTWVEPPTVLEGIASGEVEGTARWQLSPLGTATIARYEWQVRTTKRWMNLLAPIARPLFEWNHDAVMREGGMALARLLNARLLDVVSR